jgi:hypothetical protein
LKNEVSFVFESYGRRRPVSVVSGPWKRENFFIDEVSPFVTDTIWLGIANDLLARLILNRGDRSYYEGYSRSIDADTIQRVYPESIFLIPEKSTKNDFLKKGPA